MSLTGAHLEALLVAGATAEQIVALVKVDIAERERTIEDRRAKDAARQQRRRHAESRGVTRTERDTADGPSPLTPPLKSSPDPEKITPPITPQPDLSAEPTPLTVNEVVEAWNERMAPQGFPAVKRLTGTRLRQLKARLRENTIDDWQQAMSALEQSKFCRGDNGRGWRANFDFLLQPGSFTKLLEGSYS